MIGLFWSKDCPLFLPSTHTILVNGSDTFPRCKWDIRDCNGLVNFEDMGHVSNRGRRVDQYRERISSHMIAFKFNAIAASSIMSWLATAIVRRAQCDSLLQ
jgi:hypothetical protein